jgi:hypothetical protein
MTPWHLDEHGAQHYPAALSNAEQTALQATADAIPMGRPGQRLFADGALARMLQNDGSIGRLAWATLGAAARPVRVVLFDKTADANWAVAWHQDRTIAVRERRDVAGFGPWSRKAGLVHVEPPFPVIAGMITLRIHLDDCDGDNAPLLIAPGSHRLGRVPAAEAGEVARRLGEASCPAAAGDVWAYATSIVHASDRARRPQRRRVFQVDYAAKPLPGGLEWLGVTA